MRRFIVEQPLGVIGAVVIAVMVMAAAFAGWVAPFDPVKIDLSAPLSAPSDIHLLGTDAFGRDILSRVIYGARTALAIGMLSSIYGCTLGAVLGIVSAYLGGRIDLLVQRGVDILLSFPVIMLALVVVAILGKRVFLGIDLNLIWAIGLPMVPQAARIMRSSALSIARLPYIDAAKTCGFSQTRIILRHIAPNVAAPYLVLLTAYIAQAILLEASLSFLGLGVTEPTPAWGLMLSGDTADFYREAPWMILFPGLAISMAVFAFNLLGDALRDWLDPKLNV